MTEFDSKLKQGNLKHLKYDHSKKEILWVKPKLPKTEDDPTKESLYDKLPIVDIADALRFVHEKTNFLSAFTPLQPHYSKQKLDVDLLIGTVIGQATNMGNHKMDRVSDLSHYSHFLVPPVGQINKQIILKEKENMDRIVASLASKEIIQSTLVRKLCSLSTQNATRQAVEEYDKLIQTIYILKCILDPKIQANSHRSQNRIEAYHSLRSHISKIGGRKALLGRTDLQIEISNQCGRLLANAVIFYNSFIISYLIEHNL